MSIEWVEVRSCAWLYEAQFIKSLLEASGISVLIPDQYTLGVEPFYAAAFRGVRVLVPSTDLERADALLRSGAAGPKQVSE